MQTTTHERIRFRDPSSGMSLPVVMVLVIALLGIGMTSVWFATQSTMMARNINSRQQAWNAAKAGFEHGRAVLTTLANANAANPWGTPAPSTFNVLVGHAVTADDVPSAANPNGKGAVLFDGPAALQGVNYPLGAAQPLGSYTVWVRNDPADLAAGRYVVEASSPNMVVLHVVGRDPSGQGQVVLEGVVDQAAAIGFGNLDYGIWSKGIDPEGSNFVSAAVRF